MGGVVNVPKGFFSLRRLVPAVNSYRSLIPRLAASYLMAYRRLPVGAHLTSLTTVAFRCVTVYYPSAISGIRG